MLKVYLNYVTTERVYYSVDNMSFVVDICEICERHHMSEAHKHAQETTVILMLLWK